MKQIHQKLGAQSSILCKFCEQTFRTEQAREVHISVIHKQQRNFKCDFCQKMFNTTGNLCQYRDDECIQCLLFSKQSNVKYAGCDKSFKRKSSLKAHRARNCTGAV